MTKYMHTLNGKPASFFGGEQICFAGDRGGKIKLVNSLKQIRKEQKITKKFREKMGWDDYHEWDYDYALVENDVKERQGEQ